MRLISGEGSIQKTPTSEGLFGWHPWNVRSPSVRCLAVVARACGGLSAARHLAGCLFFALRHSPFVLLLAPLKRCRGVRLRLLF